MSNNEYREAQQQARDHGLKARHEQRLENATYTAAEVKVLTEAALRLGRREAGEEIAERIKAEINDFPSYAWNAPDVHRGLKLGYVIAQDVASQPSPDASSARTDPSMGMDLPPEPQAGSKRLPDNTGLEEDCGCIYAPGLGDHITMLCREGHMPGGPR